MDDNFNSDDLVFDEPAVPKLSTTAGQASIDRIVEDASKDRITSKKRVVQLTFGTGAPGTRNAQALWVNRFNAFRTNTLKQSIDHPFAMVDLIRFLDSVLSGGKLKLNRGKPGPNDELVWGACTIILTYGTFRWPAAQFTVTPHDHARLKTFVDDAKRDKRLTVGKWFKRTWIGFVTLSRIVRAYLRHALEEGTLSWDITIARCLSVTLVAALGSRSGDVARSRYYQGLEYMQYGHIELELVRREDGHGGDEQSLPALAASPMNIQATITMHQNKGKKDRPGDNPVKLLHTLVDPNCFHVCPITFLIIHAQRHGLLQGGSTIQQVLESAALRPDHKIMWVRPDWPVLPAFATSGPHRCDLTKPARTSQIDESIKEMGLVAGVIDRIYAHALRLGSARDLAHAPAAVGEAKAFAMEDVRQSLGHSVKAYHKGTTEEYIGDPDIDFWGVRARGQYVASRETRFAEEPAAIAAEVLWPITAAEGQAALGADSPDAWSLADSKTRARLRHTIRQDRREAIRETAAVEARLTRPKFLAAQLPSPLPPVVSTSRPALAEMSVNARRPTLDRPSMLGADTADDHTAPNGAFGVPSSDIDPVLLDDHALATAVVSPAALESLTQMIIPQPEAAGAIGNADETANLTTGTPHTIEQDEAAWLFLGDEANDHTDEQAQDAHCRFIDAYSKYNVVNNAAFVLAWPAYDPADSDSFDTTIGRHSVHGNARDEPSPFQYGCTVTPDCQFQTKSHNAAVMHARTCTAASAALVEAGVLALKSRKVDEERYCKEDGCDYVTLGKDAKRCIAAHMRDKHNFEHKSCEHGCDPTIICQVRSHYQHHIKSTHSTLWPTQCSYPDCEDTTEFSRYLLKRHLTDVHGLKDAHDHVQYFPVTGLRQATLFVDGQTCVVEHCDRTYGSAHTLLRHLRSSAHGMDHEAARNLIEEKAEYAATTISVKKREASSMVPSAHIRKRASNTGAKPVKKQKK